MSAKVVVCSTHVFWPSHCERELELMQIHLDKGDEVIQLVCRSEFDRCDNHMGLGPTPSIEDVRARCLACVSRLDRSQKLVHGNRRVIRYEELPDWRTTKVPPARPFANVDELKQYEWDGFDAGLAVASSLISHVRVTHPDTLAYSDTIGRSLNTTLRLYAAFRAFLAAERPDIVYVFNGRFAHTRALFRACQREGVRCLLHEMGSRPTHYAIYENALPQDRSAFARRARSLWQERGSDPEVRRSAERWFEDRARGAEQAWFSFVKHQDASLLPEGWNDQRPKFVAFTSSEDEFAAVGPERQFELFPRQADGLDLLRNMMRELRPDADLVIRMHPNLAGVTDPEIDRVVALASDRVLVVRPESLVSSYRLLRAADVVLSFGSTMGIEAVFWGKPSIRLGQSFYAELGGTYAPQSVAELRALLLQTPTPLDREPALIYGYYAGHFGEPYRIYQPTGVLRGLYRGVDLNEPPPASLLQRLRSRVRPAMSALIGPSATAAILNRVRGLTSRQFANGRGLD